MNNFDFYIVRECAIALEMMLSISSIGLRGRGRHSVHSCCATTIVFITFFVVAAPNEIELPCVDHICRLYLLDQNHGMGFRRTTIALPFRVCQHLLAL